MKRNIFLFIIWSKARKFEDEIRADLAHHFKIVHECEITWPRWDFTRRLWDFYGFGTRFMWWNKGRKCGRGPFKVIVVEDEKAVWSHQRDTRGQDLQVDENVYREKKELRRLTRHSNIIHASVTPEETRSQLEALDLDYLIPPSSSSLIPPPSSLIPHPSSLEQRLDRGELKFLGAGSRRECYEIPGTGLCLKCYRKAEDVTDATVKREIIRYAHDEKRSTCCQEYRYYRELKRTLPPYVFEAFPEEMRQVHLPKRGWCLLESKLENSDDTEPTRFSLFYRQSSDSVRKNLLQDFRILIGSFAAYAVRFYDIQNILVQKKPDGTLALRVVDFEPAARTLIPIDRLCSAIVRAKVIRRAERYAELHLRQKFRYRGLRPELRRKWDCLIATEGAALGLVNCRAFLENKIVNDIFYYGDYKGRPCVVKCSTKAPDSIRNEYEKLKRLFEADRRVCAEPMDHWRKGRFAFVVAERLPGPLGIVMPNLAGDMLRIAEALATTGIVWRDVIWGNFMIGADGSYRLVDAQFAIDRNAKNEDAFLRKNTWYGILGFAFCERLAGYGWNDVDGMLCILQKFVQDVASQTEVARLRDMLESSDFIVKRTLYQRCVIRLQYVYRTMQYRLFYSHTGKRDVYRTRLNRAKMFLEKY